MTIKSGTGQHNQFLWCLWHTLTFTLWGQGFLETIKERSPWEQAKQGESIEEGALEGVPAGEVDEEVHRRVEHEGQVVVNEKSYRWYFNDFPFTFDNNVDVDKFQNPWYFPNETSKFATFLQKSNYWLTCRKFEKEQIYQLSISVFSLSDEYRWPSEPGG